MDRKLRDESVRDRERWVYSNERGVCESHGGQRAMGQARARHQHESGLRAHGTAAGSRIAAGAMRLSGGERTEDEEEGVDVGAVRLLWGAAAPELCRNGLCRWCFPAQNPAPPQKHPRA